MAEYLINSETLTGIADAIRTKEGTTDPIAVSDFASRIGAIQAGGGVVSIFNSNVTFTLSKINSDMYYIGFPVDLIPSELITIAKTNMSSIPLVDFYAEIPKIGSYRVYLKACTLKNSTDSESIVTFEFDGYDYRTTTSFGYYNDTVGFPITDFFDGAFDNIATVTGTFMMNYILP